MYHSRFIFGLLMTALVSVRAQNNQQDDGIDQNDVPPECRQQCADLIQLTQRCDQQDDDDDENNDNDQVERDCVCNDQNAQRWFQDCGACVAQYPNYFVDFDDDDGINDNEVSQWAQTCNIAIGSGLPNSTGSATPTITNPPTGTGSCSIVQITTTVRDDNDDGDDDNDDDDWNTITTSSVVCGAATPTSWSTSVFTGDGTTSTVVIGSGPTGVVTSPADNALPQQTDNAALGNNAPLAYAGAGACFLFAALAL